MKKGLYFKKDKKCMVYKMDDTPHGVGEPDELIPVSESPLWCYSRQLTQGLVAEANVVYNNDETRLFVLNYNADVAQDCYVKYRELWYKVTRVDTTDDYNGEMFVYVKDTNDPTSPYSGGGGWGYGY